MTISSFRSSVSQIAQHPGQGHFPVSGLEAALHCSSNPVLRLRVAHALAEEIGIAMEVFGRCERDRIDPVLDRDMAGGRKPGNPMSERSDKIAERVGGQRSIDPAVPLGQLRVVILSAQHDLERPRATHEAREVLGGARAGEKTEGRLELTEDRRLARGKARVARQNELDAGGAYATLDLSDGDEAAGAQTPKQAGERRFATSSRYSLIRFRSTWEMK